MPRWAPANPRKMLPPPTTIAISTSRLARASATSWAMRPTIASSMPKPVVVSENASPESLSTTRWYLLPVMVRVLLLADLEPDEPADGGVGAETLHELADRGLGLADEGLLDQDLVLVERVEPTLDDLRDRLVGLALVPRELLEHRPLVRDDVGGYVVAARVPGPGRRHVQRHVVGDRARLGVSRIDAAELHEHTDRAALVLDVLVGIEQAVGRLVARHATEADVLAELCAEGLHRVADRATLEGLGLNVGVALLRYLVGEGGDERAEVGALGDEVGLAGELDDGAGPTLDGHVDRPLLGGTPGPLVGLGDA